MTEVVGEITGPISSYGAGEGTGGTTYTPQGVAYDIAVGGLPFVLVADKERPYARETAEFRTQQVDVTATTGDQSLTGWWTRGQFTFHRGEGVDYYELLGDADGVSGRYNSGENCYPWRPGEVRLANALTEITSTPMNKVVGTGDEEVAFALGQDVGWDQTVFRFDLDTATASPVVAFSGSLFIQDISEWPPGGCLVIENGVVKSVSLNGLTVTTVATLSTGAFYRVFWAKDRIFAADQDGNWYAFSDASGQTITAGVAGDAFWAGPTSQLGSMTMCDGPGAAYIGLEDRVYAVELDTSGAVPIVTTPRVAAQLPHKRIIQGLLWHMGFLVIQGFGGVRIAQDQGNGNLTLGPEVITDLGSASTSECHMASYRDIVRVIGRVRGEDAVTAVDLNLAEFTSPLTPAYATRRVALGGVETARGVGWASSGFRTTVAWSSAGAWLVEESERPPEDGVETSGFVQTGFHRFGVLEPKAFHSVSVRAKGTAGTVSISIVRKDGALQPLVTLGPDQYQEAQVNLPPLGNTEVIALRFTLAGPADMSYDAMPTLLGYQVKALPAPKRQRMIQVPLSCYDYETVGHTEHGYNGWAWERLKALEEMEGSSGVATFQDLNTGEQRQVFIERVQFQQTKSPSSGGSEFGGIVVLTLRCVDDA